MRTIHEVLEYGAIVASHEESDCLITWNGSATFNWWRPANEGWENIDVRTVYGVETLLLAEKVANGWIEDELIDLDAESVA